MPFVNCPQCKICKSKLRPEIDEMLSSGKSYTAIVSFSRKNGLDISKTNISTHKSKHAATTAEEIEKKTNESRAVSTARNKFNIKTREIVAANKCLEDIISIAYSKMADGELSPTIGDALKAMEIQAKLKETGMLENSIINFMLEFTKENAPTGPVMENVEEAIIIETEQAA